MFRYSCFTLILLAAAAQAQITVTPSSLSFSERQTGDSPYPLPIAVTGNGTVSVGSCTGAACSGILTHQTSTSAPATIYVYWDGYRNTELGPGSYTGSLQINGSSGCGASGCTVNITLNVVPYTLPTITSPSGSFTGCVNSSASFFDLDTCTSNFVPGGNFTMPTLGNTYTDPNFGGLVRRISNAPRQNDTDSTVSSWNANNTLIMTAAFTGICYLTDPISGADTYVDIPCLTAWDATDPKTYYYLTGLSIHKVVLVSPPNNISDTVIYTYPGSATQITTGGDADTSKDNWICFWADTDKNLGLIDLSNPSHNYFASLSGITPYAFRTCTVSKGIDIVTNKRYVIARGNGGTPSQILSYTAGAQALTIDGPMPQQTDSPFLTTPTFNGPHCDMAAALTLDNCFAENHSDTVESNGIQYYVFSYQQARPFLQHTTFMRFNVGPDLMSTPVESGGGMVYTMPFFTGNGDIHIGCAKKAPVCVVELDGDPPLPAWRIVNVTNGTPLQITSSPAYSGSNGDVLLLNDLFGTTTANGLCTVANLNGATFECAGKVGGGTYISGTGSFVQNVTPSSSNHQAELLAIDASRAATRQFTINRLAKHRSFAIVGDYLDGPAGYYGQSHPNISGDGSMVVFESNNGVPDNVGVFTVANTTGTGSTPAPPYVFLTGPAAGATISGKNVAVSATAVAASGLNVTGLQFQVDGAAVGSAFTGPGPYTLTLDSTSLKNGTRILTAVATDSSGGNATSAPIAVTSSNAGMPVVTMTAPVDGSTVSGNSVAVSATATASTGLTISSVQFLLDGANTGTPVTGTGPYGITLDTTALPDGAHTLSAVATDSTGGNATSAVVNVIVSNNPVAAVTAPAPGATISGTVAVTATASAAKGRTISSIQMRVDGNNVGNPITGSGPYSYSLDTTSLSNGTHALSVAATDSAQKKGTSPSISVTVANGTVAVTAPSAGATVSGRSVTLTATAIPPPGRTVSSIQFQVDGVNNGAAITTSPYTATLDSTLLTNGTHLIAAVATDSASNIATSAAVSITVNNPLQASVTIGAPAANATISGAGVTVSATAAAASGKTIASLQFLLDGVNTGSSQTGAGPFSITLDSTKIVNGPHVLTAVATDSANAAIPATAVNITVSNGLSPTVSITAPVAGANLTGKSVTVSATAAAPSGRTMSSAQLLVDGVSKATLTQGSPYNFTLDSTTLSNGPHTLAVVAADSTNASTISAGVPVAVANAAAPAVTLTAPVANAAIAGNAVKLSATATAAGALTIASVQFNVDGNPSGAAVTASPYQTFLDTTKLTNGSHTVTAVATDSANNTGSSAVVTVTVNNASVAVNTPAANAVLAGAAALKVTVTGTPVSVQYQVDSVTVATVTASPFAATLDTTTLANGVHSLSAIATDAAGNLVSSAAVSITINNMTVAIKAPAANATVSGAVALGVTVAGTPTKVVYQVDLTTVATVTASPFSGSLDTGSLTNGSHSLTAIASDGAGNSVTSAAVSFKVANANSPAVTVTAPAAGATIAGANVTISATASASAGLTIANLQFKLDGSNTGAAINGAGPYSVAIDTTTLANGAHTLSAMATDSLGTSGTSALLNVTVSNPASVSITAPASGASLSGNSVTLTALANAAAGRTTTSVQFKVDGAVVGTSTSGTANSFSVTWDSTTLADGAHTLTAIATDSTGATTTSAVLPFNTLNGAGSGPTTALVTGFSGGSTSNAFTWYGGMQFTVASTPLKVSALGRVCIAGNQGTHILKLVNPANNIDIVGGSVTVSLAGCTPGLFVYAQLPGAVTLSANTAYNLVSQEFAGGDTWYNYNGITTTNVASVNGATYNPSQGYQLVTYAQGTSYGPLNLKYSTGSNPPPTVSISAPAANSSVSGTLTVTASATGSGVAIAAVQFQVDGTNFGNAATGSPYSTSLNTAALSNGGHTLTAIATDANGSSAVSAGVAIGVGNHNAPNVSISTPLNGATVSGAISVTAAASAAAGYTVASVQLQLDGGALGPLLTAAPYTAGLDTTKIANGSHTVTALAIDSGGLSTTAAVFTFISANGASATVAITSPAASAMVSGSNVALAATATPGAGSTISSVQFQVDGTAYAGTVTYAGGAYQTTLDSTKFANGAHSVTAIATTSNNVSVPSGAVSFTINNMFTGAPLVIGFSEGPLRNNYGSWVGMQFTVGSTPLTVTQLGRIYLQGNTQSHQVKLARVSDGSDVPGGLVTVTLPSGTPGQFAYASLASPVTLAANTAYILASLENSGGDLWGDYAPVTATAAVTMNGPEYFDGRGWVLVPFGNYSYVPVNLIYGGSSSPSTVSISTPAANATVSGNNVPISASVVPGTGLTIASVQFKLDGAKLGNALTASPYQATFDSTAITAGAHSLTAVATDSGGNTVTSAGVTITVNNSATVVSIGSPGSGANVAGSAVAVSATATPATGLTLTGVQFKVDGVNAGPAIAASPYQTTFDSTKLSNGPHTLTAVATDSGGTSVPSNPVGINVSNTTIALSNPAANSNISGASVAVSAAVTPGTGLTVTGVQFKVDGTNLGSAIAASPFQTTLDATKLTGGTHTISATSTDSSGTSATASITVNVGATSVSFSAPAANANVAGTAVPVTATASNTGGLSIASVQFKLDGVNLGSAITASPFRTTFDSTKQSSGTHTLTATATDSGGGSASASIGINVSNTAISVTAPLANATVSGASVQVSAAPVAGAGLTITNVQFQLDGASLGSAITTSPYQTAFDSTKQTGGTHTLTAMATDSGNNTITSQPVSFSINNTVASPPAVSVTTPSASATLSGAAAPLAATASASAGLTIASVQFKLDGATNIGAALTASPYRTSFDSTAFPDGAHTISAVAVDSSGASTTSAAVGVTLSNAAGGPSGTAFVTGGSYTYLRNNASTFVGMQINVGAKALTVTGLGRLFVSGNSGTHRVKLVGANNVDVPGAFVDINMTGGTAQQFKYGALSSPVVLQPGTTYFLVSQEAAGQDQFYDFSPVNITSVATVPGSVYFDGSIYYLVSGASQYSFGPVNFLYTLQSPSSVSISSPSSGATLSGSQQVAAVPTAGSGLTVSSVQFKVDGANAANGLVTGSPYQFTLDTTKLGNGSHALTAVVTDSGGGTATSTAVSITVSNAVTSVSITAPSAGSVNGSVPFSASATPAAGLTIASVQFKVDGAALTGGTVTSSPYQVMLDTTKLSNGAHSLTAVATDSGGGTATSTAVSITVSNALTSVSITAPSSGAVNGSVPFSANATPAAGLTIASVQFKVDGTALTGGTVTSSPYQVTLDTTKLSNGAHSLTAVATDSGGGTATSTAVSITVTNAVTSVSITAPSAGSVNGSVLFSAAATPKVGLTITSVQFKVDGATLTGGTVTNSPYQVTLDTSKLSNGAHSLTAVATDSGGGTATSNAVSITVANAATGVMLTAPAASSILSGKAAALSASATAGVGLTIVNVQFTIDGATKIGATVTASPYQTSFDSTAFPDGTHTIAAIVLDSSGASVTSTSVSVTISNAGTAFITGGSFTSLRNNTSLPVGMRIDVGSKALTVTALGRIFVPGNTGTHHLKLVNAATNVDVPGGAVDLNMTGGVAQQFKYAALASPVVLQAGTQYYLISQESNGGDQFYDYSAVNFTAAGSVGGPVYFDGSNYVLVGTPQYSYGPVNFLYQ